MESISALTGNPLYSLIAMASSPSTTGAAGASSPDDVAPAVALDLSSVQLQGELMASLLPTSTLGRNVNAWA